MANTYGKVSGTFEEIENAYGKVSGVWKEADEIYGKVSGVWKLVFSAFEATSFATVSSGSGTFTVPAQANAIHIQAAVGGGGGGVKGADYDKAGGESSGAGGGSGSFISDKVFSVTAGETISYAVGAGGALLRANAPAPIQQGASVALGNVVNPHVALLFEGVNLKTFTFQWRFSPDNEGESILLKKILNKIKKHIYPRFTQSGGD